jgi:hypothetical protein
VKTRAAAFGGLKWPCCSDVDLALDFIDSFLAKKWKKELRLIVTFPCSLQESGCKEFFSFDVFLWIKCCYTKKNSCRNRILHFFYKIPMKCPQRGHEISCPWRRGPWRYKLVLYCCLGRVVQIWTFLKAIKFENLKIFKCEYFLFFPKFVYLFSKFEHF